MVIKRRVESILERGGVRRACRVGLKRVGRENELESWKGDGEVGFNDCADDLGPRGNLSVPLEPLRGDGIVHNEH